MRFAHPILLLLLAAIPLLLWLRRRPLHGSLRYSRTTNLTALPISWRARLQPIFPLLYALGIACLIIALARPQRGLQRSTTRTETVDIVLLLDLSGSMEETDFVKNRRRITRLDAAKDVIARFLEKRPNDRIGLVAFASDPYAAAPLTLDHAWLARRVAGLHTNLLDNRYTAIGDAIASALNRLNESKAKSRIVILLTDGESNWGSLTPENAARAAEALGIRIYTIAAGGASTGFFSIASRPIDATVLRKIADLTGGRFYTAKDLETLDAIYAEIDLLEKTEIDVEQYTRYEELAGTWIRLAAILLAAEHLLSLTKLGRLP